MPPHHLQSGQFVRLNDDFPCAATAAFFNTIGRKLTSAPCLRPEQHWSSKPASHRGEHPFDKFSNGWTIFAPRAMDSIEAIATQLHR